MPTMMPMMKLPTTQHCAKAVREGMANNRDAACRFVA
jgi:hypothetical protein